MRIPILSDESRESLITEMVDNQGGDVYQKLLELASDNPKLYEVILYLANQFETKEDTDLAALSMTAIICLIEAELERENLETLFTGDEK